MGLQHERRYREFLRRLRAAREVAGFSQKEAARRLRWNQSRISRSETGARRIDALELADLCLLYGVRPEVLIPEFQRIK
jgi:transcriptional regulator with XRE-family HTH domain